MDMAEGPTLSDFMRHLQAVLEESTDIPDAKEQQQRQWQIEAAIQEAIIFGNRYRELQEHGIDPCDWSNQTQTIQQHHPSTKLRHSRQAACIVQVVGHTLKRT